jgi:hypothetical protein
VKYVKLGHTGTDVSAIDLCVAPVIVFAAQEVDMVEQSGGDPEVDGGSEPWTPTGEELAPGSVSAAASPRTPWLHRVCQRLQLAASRNASKRQVDELSRPPCTERLNSPRPIRGSDAGRGAGAAGLEA